MSHLDLSAVDALAAAAHGEQKRKHGTPYISHPRAVLQLTEDLALACRFSLDDDTRAAALLHDVIEDTHWTLAELESQVGPVASRRVSWLTKPELACGQTKSARDHDYFSDLREEADDDTRLVKIADRLHNLSELHLAPRTERSVRYRAETLAEVIPLAQACRHAGLRLGLEAALHEGLRQATHLAGDGKPAPPDRPAPGLYVILDIPGQHDRAHVARLLQAAIEGGARLVQLRCKNLTDREMLAWVESLTQAAGPLAPPVLVNDRADIAWLTAAQGVHVGQTDLPAGRLRDFLRSGAIIGASSHTLDQVSELLAAGGLDYVAFGPVFASPTKQGHAEVTGLGRLAEVTGQAKLPVCAIGGFTDTARVAAAAHAGATWVAVISAVAQAEHPAWLVRRFALTHAAAFRLRERA